MTTSLTVTSKGQVTLRKDLLAHLGLRPGQRLDVELLPGGALSCMPNRPPKVSRSCLACLRAARSAKQASKRFTKPRLLAGQGNEDHG